MDPVPARPSVRILLVEDDADFAEIVRRQLGAVAWADLSVEWAKTLGEALALLAGSSVDLVITDLGLPDSAGLATLERLAGATDRLIIVLTGMPDPRLPEEALARGAYDLVSKDRLDRAGLERLVRLAAMQANTFRALRDSEARFRSLTELTSDWYWEQDAQFRFTVLSGPGAAAMSRGGDPGVYLGKARWEIPDLEPAAGDWSAHRAQLERHEPFRDAQFRRRMADGSVRYMSVSGGPLHDRQGRFIGYRGGAQDITDRKRAEAALHLRNRALESSVNSVMITEQTRAGHAIVYVNPAFERVTGYAAAEVMGRDPRFLHGEDRDQPGVHELRAAVREEREATVLLRNYRKDGTVFWNELRVAPVRDDAGRVTHMVGVTTDVTDRIRYQEQIERQASYDSLTGLPNRNLLNDRAAQAVLQASRSGRALGVMFIDVDHLKRINDSLGHEMGDKVIAAVARRIADTLRAGDTVARLSGGEFVALLADLQRDDDASVVASKLMNAIGAPLRIEAHEFVLTASAGIAVHPKDGADAATLLRNADTALYRAKESGRACFRFFAPEMNERVVRFLALERDLRRALEERELTLHYQPIVRLGSGEAVGAEALLRWPRADGSVTGPAQFIPVAEESGLIVPIGRWVLAQAAHQAAEWNRGRRAPFVVSINLSTRQFRDPGLREAVQAATGGAGVDPSLLRLEITESAVMHNLEEGTRLLHELKDLGVKLSVDDFGTGYSSLGYLKSFPIDTLKIDRSFVRGLPGDRDSLAICRAVIALGRGMGAEVVAEGVETRAQARMLAAEGCELAQGYLFGKPAEPERIRPSRTARKPARGKET